MEWTHAPGDRLRVDLETCTIVAGPRLVAFEIDPSWRIKLLNGWDDLDLTLSYADRIANFCRRDGIDRPWAAPGTSCEEV